MTTTEEQQVLLLLAKEWDYSGPPGILDISDIVAALGQAPGATLQALKSLFQCGSNSGLSRIYREILLALILLL